MINSNLSQDDVYSMSEEDFQKVISQMNTQTSIENKILDNSVSNEDKNNNSIQTSSNEPESNKNSTSNEEILQENSNESQTNNDLLDKDSTKEDFVENESKEDKYYTIKADGQEINLTLDELISLAPKALNYTHKLQKIAPFRRAINALEENKISEEELNQLIEIRNGNSIAIKNLLDMKKIPTSEITSVDEDTSKNYKPKEYGQSESELEWQEMVITLQTNPNYETMRTYVNSLDAESQELIKQNPQALENFLRDIEAGVFKESCALAQKNKLMETGQKQPEIMYYISAVQSLWDKKQAELRKQVEPKVQEAKKPIDSNSKANARLSGDKSTSSKPQKVIQMLTDIDDEEYQAFLQNARRQY